MLITDVTLIMGSRMMEHCCAWTGGASSACVEGGRMNESRFSIDVATGLFQGYVLTVSRSEFLRRDAAGDWPKITHADRVAAFERYEAENGARTYYLEEEFDENGEEIDEYDPYLWMRPVDAPAEENWREITLEDAVRHTENHLGTGDYRIDDVRMIDNKSLRSAVESFCRNDYWNDLYENASPRVRKFLAMRFLESEDGDLVEANDEEYEEARAKATDRMTVEDWEYYIASLKGQGGAAAREAKECERLLRRAHEVQALKGKSVSRCLREIKQAYADWKANRLNDERYNAIAHECQQIVERLAAINRAPENQLERFEREYTNNMYTVND